MIAVGAYESRTRLAVVCVFHTKSYSSYYARTCQILFLATYLTFFSINYVCVYICIDSDTIQFK